MIRKHHSLQTAENVFSLLDYILENDDELIDELRKKDLNLHLECFDNCREQGYVLVFGMIETKWIAVCESRNSDTIKIYEYDKVQFPSNLPREEDSCWTDYKSFSYGKVFEAAKYIRERIRKMAEESQ